MVKQKLIFAPTPQNTTQKSSKKKKQSTGQNQKTVPQSQESKSQTTTPTASNSGKVEDQNTVSVSNTNGESVKTVSTESASSTDEKTPVVDDSAPEQILTKNLSKLRRKYKKFTKLETEITTDLDILYVSIKSLTKKSKKKKNEEASKEELEEIEKQEKEQEARLNEQKRRQKQLQETLDVIQTTQSTLDSLETIALDITKAARKKGADVKAATDNLKNLERDGVRKEKRLQDQEKIINELESQVQLYIEEVKQLRDQTKLQETKITDYEQQIHRFSKQLSEVDSLKQQLQTERTKNRNYLQQQDQYVQQLQHDLKLKQDVIERQHQFEQQSRETLVGHVHDLRQKSAKIFDLESKLEQQNASMRIHHQELELVKQQISGTEKALRELQMRHDATLSDVEQKNVQISQLQDQLHDYAQRSAKLQKALESAEYNTQQLILCNQDLEQKLQQQPPLIVPVKFEEDILNDIIARRNQQPHHQYLQDVMKIIQVIDYFDISKPDGMDIRSMFISDQISLRKDGKHTMFGSYDEFDAFDHMCRVIRGSQQLPQSRESSVADAVSFIQKLLSVSIEEVIPGITFKVLSEQIAELQTSNIYLTGRTLYPHPLSDLGSSDVAYGFTSTSSRGNQTLSRPDLFTDGFNFAAENSSTPTHAISLDKNISHQYMISSNTTQQSTDIAPPSKEEYPINAYNTVNNIKQEEPSHQPQVSDQPQENRRKRSKGHKVYKKKQLDQTESVESTTQDQEKTTRFTKDRRNKQKIRATSVDNNTDQSDSGRTDETETVSSVTATTPVSVDSQADLVTGNSSRGKGRGGSKRGGRGRGRGRGRFVVDNQEQQSS